MIGGASGDGTGTHAGPQPETAHGTTSKLNDLQLILLSTAAQRDNGSLLPPADSIAGQEERIRKALTSLLRRGLIEEVPIKDRVQAWRDEDEQPLGLVLTSAGRAVIATEDGSASAAGGANAPADKNDAPTPPACTGTKAELVLALLRRSEGATLSELVDATGWLSHTTRAALTGLRKKGHVLEKTKRDDATCYRIAEAD